MLKQLLCILFAGSAAILAAEPIILQKELKLDAAAKGATTKTIEIPAVKIPAGKIAVLKFNCRIAHQRYAGWGNLLQIVLNKKVLEGKTANGEQRILFRDSIVKTSNRRSPEVPWFGKNRRNTALLIFYAPEQAVELSSHIRNNREAGFDYVIRIDDLLQNGKKNQLKLNYLLQKRFIQNRNMQLVIRNLAVDFIDPPENNSNKPVIKNGELILSERIAMDAPTAGTTELEIDFPAVQVPFNKVPILAFNARIATPGMSGWNNYLQLNLNGKRITGETADGEYRLLHRGKLLKTALARDSVRNWWRGRKGEPALLLFFAPESAKTLDKRILTSRECAYDYEIDISDLVNRVELGADDRIESSKNNKLKLTYLLFRRAVGNKNIQLIIKNLRIKFIDKKVVEKSRPAKEVFKLDRKAENAELKLVGGKTVLEVTSNGALQFRLGNEIFFMDSFFSYPAQPRMKYNAFGKNSAGNAENWQIKKKLDGGKLLLQGKSGSFEITREITYKDNKFFFHDKIKNVSEQNAALAFFDRFSSHTADLSKVKLAGQANINGAVDFFGISNPTLFLAGKNNAVGAVYIDTLSRAQLQLRSQSGLYEAGSIGCGAKPGDTIEREFAVYTAINNNYFDFINQIRNDWGVNKHTIPGPFGFSPRGPQPPKPGKLASLRPWFEFCYYGNNNTHDGALMSREEFTKIAQKQIKALRSKRKDIRIFGCIENNLVPFDCRKYEWTKAIRQKGVNEPRNAPGIKYGLFLNKELTAKLDAVTPLKDSIIRSADGRAMIDNMYPSKPVINLMVQPEIGNYRFKQMIEQIDFLMDKVGVDSIYIDQFQPYIIGGFSENRWDGRTVELASDGSIKRYRYSYALTGATARAAIIKHITDKGGLVLTNGQSMSREEQSLFRLAFQEMENDTVNPLFYMDEQPPEFRWQSVSHLGCPIALGIRPRKYLNVNVRPNRAAEVQTKGVITALRNGLLYYVYIYDIHADNKSDSGSFDMFERMFPFTPVEINEGFLIGKERTITAVSRKFTVSGSKKPVCTHYNKRGIPSPAKFAVSGKPGKWTVDVKLKNWNEIAIIEVKN